MTIIASPPKCDANATGRTVTDWGLESLPCNTRVGLRSFTDRQGTRRFYCAAPEHRENVERRFGRYVSPAAIVVEACPGCGPGMRPSHDASPRCESGGHPHCSCDVCF